MIVKTLIQKSVLISTIVLTSLYVNAAAFDQEEKTTTYTIVASHLILEATEVIENHDGSLFLQNPYIRFTSSDKTREQVKYMVSVYRGQEEIVAGQLCKIIGREYIKHSAIPVSLGILDGSVGEEIPFIIHRESLDFEHAYQIKSGLQSETNVGIVSFSSQGRVDSAYIPANSVVRTIESIESLTCK